MEKKWNWSEITIGCDLASGRDSSVLCKLIPSKEEGKYYVEYIDMNFKDREKKFIEFHDYITQVMCHSFGISKEELNRKPMTKYKQSEINLVKRKAYEIVMDTVRYYSWDVNRRGVKVELKYAGTDDRGERIYSKHPSCDYLTPEGKMCGVGRCLTPEALRKVGGPKGYIGTVHGLNSYLLRNDMDFQLSFKKKYRGMPMSFWSEIQSLHDSTGYWKEGVGLTPLGGNRVQSIYDWIERYSTLFCDEFFGSMPGRRHNSFWNKVKYSVNNFIRKAYNVY